MARLLIAEKGLKSYLYSSLALAKSLRYSGHEIMFCCPADVRASVEENGFPYTQLDSSRFGYRNSEEVGGRSKQNGKTETSVETGSFSGHDNSRADDLGSGSFINLIDRWKPDMLLINFELHPHILAALSTDIPTMLTLSLFSIWRRPGVPRPGA